MLNRIAQIKKKGCIITKWKYTEGIQRWPYVERNLGSSIHKNKRQTAAVNIKRLRYETDTKEVYSFRESAHPPEFRNINKSLANAQCSIFKWTTPTVRACGNWRHRDCPDKEAIASLTWNLNSDEYNYYKNVKPLQILLSTRGMYSMAAECAASRDQ